MHVGFAGQLAMRTGETTVIKDAHEQYLQIALPYTLQNRKIEDINTLDRDSLIAIKERLQKAKKDLKK